MIFLDFHNHILHNTKFTNRMEYYEEMAMRKQYPLAAKHTAISFESFSQEVTRINPVGSILKDFEVVTEL